MARNLSDIIPAFLTGPGGARLTPEQIAQRRAASASLIGQATDTSPNAGGVASIITKALLGGMAGYDARTADQAGVSNAENSQNRIARMLGGLGGTGGVGQGATVASPTVAPMQNVSGGADPVGEVIAAAPSSGPATAQSAAKSADVSFSGKSPFEVASSLIGKGEVPDRSTLMEFFKNGGQNLDPATTAWCAAFVNSSLGAAGMQGTGKLNARSFLDWGTPVDTPQRGDVAVFSRGDPNGWQGHVGFFDSTNPDGTINVLGGNQGNGVSVAPYSADRLLGYRRAPTDAGIEGALAASNTSAFPPAPTAGGSGINPDIIAALGPYSSPEERSVAGLLLNQQFSQQEAARQAALAQQKQQEALAQRQSVAQSMGINPAYAMDENAWKAAVEAANRGRQTATVNGTVIDVNTGQPIYTGAQQPTTGMQDYQFYADRETAAGRTPLGPLEYEQALRSSGAARTNIDTGTVPQGYQAVRDEQGRLVRYEPVPGGPADTTKIKENAAVNTQRSGNIVLEDVDRAVSAIENNPTLTTGLIGNWSKGVGGTPANKVNNLLQTIRANSAFDRLQQMREASPTGGALGAVSDSELGLLQNAIGSLEQSNDSEDLVYNLRRVQRIYEDIINGPEGAKRLREERSKGINPPENPLPEQNSGWRDAGNGIRIRPKGGN